MNEGDFVPIQPVGQPAATRPRQHYDAPYRLFLFTSLALALGGGFALAVALPLAGALEWDWGLRWPALVQAHGQLQLLGFAGLFVMGMALRLMPRFSGRDIPYTALVPVVLVSVAVAVVLRAVAQPFFAGGARDAGVVVAAALLLAGALAFAAIIWRSLLHPASRAEATGWFFALGAVAYVGAAALNLSICITMARDGEILAPHAEDEALVFLQLFGFVLLFLMGVGLRAIPALTGHQRPDAASRVIACLLAASVALYTAVALYAAYRAPVRATGSLEDIALIGVAMALLGTAWFCGALRPVANRVARASQAQFRLVQAAAGWMAVAGALMLFYAISDLRDGGAIDQFEMDAVRHTVTVGVVTMMIIGMAMLVVPEFAGRRLQRPGERLLAWVLAIGLSVATALRVWPATRGIDWLASTRFWPMAAAGIIAIIAVGAFAFVFGQSYAEQRAEGWSAAAVAARRGEQQR
jgi:hypothetical protein